MSVIGRCTKHGSPLVEKPWCRGRKGWPGTEVLVCLVCVAETKAKVRLERARPNNHQSHFSRRESA